ncbi:uncharacterized protein LAESUDRAFT_649114 [Laetiporus sulphureus 93-53]|uniref:Transcription activator of gluconeogenesis ERT1 n=1 Tax=Laetiporus sulphureus 93-53 TaxID=1314785 RepID=A0A165F4F4_9APHY|nr:uncharacterized protein LAESUDRAFT_649114 [Laetiporus sulphureus 93-53]KZT08364.1 hypothetical protein LAESUDRAFT_649114 [Laetiporus sulphureus 93-53]
MPTALTQQPTLPPYHLAPSSASTSEQNTPAADPKKKSAPKRRRPQDATSDSADSSSQPSRTREGPKKKKANRACFHCQKAHLTCDDSRPCQRCVKRGMADNCTEGHRKKAKYLLDEEELAPPEPQYVPSDTMYSAYGGTPYALGSEGANLEYSILSAILGNSPDSTGAQNAGSPAAPSATAAWAGETAAGAGSAIAVGPQNGAVVYQAVTKPYDYTEGYHFLMKHLPTRFDKNDILRIVRALAIFRPSLIALQMPLSEEDEVFVEKCFQRSLIELDKLVSFSGTPTVAWRRTGEICLVGPEFCMLTGWEKEELIGRRKYIYELFENQSVVEYWENFANHAFENTTQSVYSHCVLLKPSGAPVPCTFCFSIRRDIMDLPSLVIGQWLPLL